jgi:hypothetical protein
MNAQTILKKNLTNPDVKALVKSVEELLEEEEKVIFLEERIKYYLDQTPVK